MQKLLNNEVPIAEIGKIDAVEFLTTVKTVHFIMQDILMQKMLNVVEVQQIEKEKSAFDEYDRENGYVGKYQPASRLCCGSGLG